MKNVIVFFTNLVLYGLKTYCKPKCFALKGETTKSKQRENKNLRNDYVNFFDKIKERLRNDYANLKNGRLVPLGHRSLKI